MSAEGLVQDSSLEFLSSRLSKEHRVVVLGASGWVGQTAVLLLQRLGIDFLAIGSINRNIQTPFGVLKILMFDSKVISDFAPTLILDFAFLTREKIDEYGVQRFVLENQKLINQGIWCFSLESVKFGVATSSGAALMPSEHHLRTFGRDYYSELKKETELRYLEAAQSSGKAITIMRPWSVSGPLVTKVHGFAFSDFAFQALSSNKISIKSNRPVFRRYVFIEELIILSIASAQEGLTSVLDSGGELIELSDLANLISAELGKVEIERSLDLSLPGDNYFSDNKSWQDALGKFNFEASGLRLQIQEIIRRLRTELKS